ncbi:GNAT family N-acetyltransferase [Couchioplanes azureus]|uniref:GNAT family N-acetyltransferase n=1 Tax=Couchioplanes caeruleus TaxID=56438 RepID=UPI00167053DC|nr:GNAT family N-acetyltransferase [Couchioplanes caeruleus]GGQ68036.1 hypothetical protein GCM10010166_42550 [Couchioplanes caeruleus subsp. azureus]
MEYPTTFEAHGLRLRPYRDADVPNLVAAFSDPETLRFMSGTPGEVTTEKAQAFVRGLPATRNPDRHSYAVADPVTDELLAGAVLHVTRRRSSGEVGFWVCPAARGRGVATATTRAMTDLGFAHGLCRVELFIRDENVRSQRVALAAGFRREAALRDVLPGPGSQRHTAVVWSRLSTDDGAPAPRLLPDLPGGALTDGVVTVRPAGGCALPAARWLAGEGAELLACESATGEIIGELTLDYVAPGDGEAVLRGTLADSALAARSIALVTDWAFRIGVARLVSAGPPDGQDWQRLLTRAGFRAESRLVR